MSKQGNIFNIQQEHAIDIADSLSKRKLSDYETLGDLAKDIRAFNGLIGQYNVQPNQEDGLKKRISALEKENSELKTKLEKENSELETKLEKENSELETKLEKEK